MPVIGSKPGVEHIDDLDATVVEREPPWCLLAAIDPSTEVAVDGTAEVAGRAAYELVVTPRDDRSLVEDVRLAVDGATSMPLRVEVNSTGADEPAFEVGFTSVTFGEPAADVYRFNPPPGATLDEHEVIAHCRLELAAYKVPKEVCFLEALPKSNVGKILRKDLRTLP